MTEYEWLTSTDPAAPTAILAEKIKRVIRSHRRPLLLSPGRDSP